MRLPRLLIAGANWRERAIAAAGALLGIALAALGTTWLSGSSGVGLLLAAPIGASAVLVFAVPSSPMGQPWPVIGGNIVSAVVGIAVAQRLGHSAAAAGVAVSVAILAMSVLRCLHPSGGGTALLGVVGGPAVLAHGYAFALVPVGLNAVLLVAGGVLFHLVSGHSYPHRVAKVQAPRITGDDIDAALEQSGEAYDIAREDLQALFEAAERHVEARRKRR